MPGLVDAAHPALAEEVEDDVAAEDQALRFTFEDLPRLEGRQHPVLDQARGQLGRLRGIIPLGHIRFDFLELLLGQDGRTADRLEEL